MNLILNQAMFLPIASFQNDNYANCLDAFLHFKGFLIEKRIQLYKETTLEDEIINQLNLTIDPNLKKQLEYKTRLIFQRPRPIDIETTSNANNWDIIFEYIDINLLPNNSNGFTGLDTRNLVNIDNHVLRFVYNQDSWYKLSVYFWKQKNKISTIDNILPNNELTNILIIDTIKKNDISNDTIKMTFENKLNFFSNGFYKTIEEGTLINLAFQIAIDNGYIHDSELSNLNSKLKKQLGSKGKSSISVQNTRRKIFRIIQ